jgi:hypothetical protein
MNRMFGFMNIPLQIDTNTMMQMTEEDLFLSMWDIYNFVQEEACDTQVYKMWSEKLQEIVNESDDLL